MDENSFHEQMAASYEKQRLSNLDKRPPDVSVTDWKNRTLVSAKLDRETFTRLLAYCKERDYSFNTGLKTILTSYFKTNA